MKYEKPNITIIDTNDNDVITASQCWEDNVAFDCIIADCESFS